MAAPDFSVGCNPGYCDYYEYGKPVSEKTYKIPQQMLIQKNITTTPVWNKKGKNKKKKKQKKTSQPIINSHINKKIGQGVNQWSF